MSLESPKMVYCAYFHSIMSYRLIFWGNSSHSSNIFKIQKTIIRIITGCRRRDSCRNLFFLSGIYNPLWVSAASFWRFRDHTQGHNTVGRTPLDEWSARRRDLYLTNTQHLQETDIQTPGRIRTRSPSKRSAVDTRLRPLRHLDRRRNLFKKLKFFSLQSQYILSIPLFVVNNKNKFKIISDVHHINTRQKTFTSLLQIYHYIKKKCTQLT
jgi:hypothetical protein